MMRADLTVHGRTLVFWVKAICWILMLTLVVVALSLFCGCSRPPNKRITGGVGLGPKETTIDLNEQERAALAAVQDRRYPDVSKKTLLEASVSALKQADFQHVVADPVTEIAEGEFYKRIAPEWVAKVGSVLVQIAKTPAPPIPDHATVRALVVVRQDAKADTLLRVRFGMTEWNARGDSESKTVTDAEPYNAFFTLVQRALTTGTQQPNTDREITPLKFRRVSSK